VWIAPGRRGSIAGMSADAALSVARVLLVCAFGVVGMAAEAATAIGKVSRVQGPCTGTVEGATRVLTADSAVFLGDAIATGAEARLEVALDDATVLTVGENAEVRLDRFVYWPQGRSRLSATVNGAFRFVSAALGPGASRQASVTTPYAVIGVRGTDFWGGPIDGTFGVVLFDGAVSVSNGGGSVILDDTQQGTSVESAVTAPAPVVIWTQDKIDRAVATVTFQ